jgi:protein arginine kinase activator
MLCERCGENEAIIHLTQIENNQMHTSHLCEGCAAEKGLDTGVAAGSSPLSDFISQVGKVGADSPVTGPCPYCGMKLDEFKKLGRLGCPQCYVAFDPHLKGLLRRLHSGTQHLGKVYLPPDPTQAERQERLAGLRRKLDKAVESEDFERAAQIRDMIRTLEGVAS